MNAPWFSSYGPKCFQSIRLQDSFKRNISKRKRDIKLTFVYRETSKFPTS